MKATHVGHVLREVECLLAEQALANAPDGGLLDLFARRRDEAAFDSLLRRHGPMVLRVCRDIMTNAHDAEDAFQATFLVLACNAAKVRNRASVAGFLHGTAYRVAVRAKGRAARRRAVEREAAQMCTGTTETGRAGDTLETIVHEELARMPEAERQALVLCHLEGQTHEQAAAALRWPVGSVSRRLKRACERLRERLAGRGVALPAVGSLVAGLAVSSQAAVPATLATATVRVVGDHVAGSTLMAASGVPAVALAREVLHSMNALKLTGLAALVVIVGLVASGTALRSAGDGPRSPAPPPGVDGQVSELRPGEPGDRDEGAPPARDEAPRRPVLDRHGDPLPPGALLRVGTGRLRHSGPVSAVTFSSDGRTLASAAIQDSVRLWGSAGGELKGELDLRNYFLSGGAVGLALSPDGKTIATGNPDCSVSLWDVEAKKERCRLTGHAGLVRTLFFTPDGKTLITTGGDGSADDGTVRFWDAAGGEGTGSIKADARWVLGAALSADGKTLATGGEDQVIRLWNVADRKPFREFRAGDRVFRLAFAPDGRTVASAEGRFIRLVDAGNGTERRKIETATGSRGLAFSPDGKLLASAEDSTVALHDTATGALARRLKGHSASVMALAFSPDGTSLASGGQDQAVRVWDVATGKERLLADQPAGAAVGAAIMDRPGGEPARGGGQRR
jgi:RNA polymerase sigma factor (sigma-70 family)